MIQQRKPWGVLVAWNLVALTGPGSAMGQSLATTRVASELSSPLYVVHAPGDFERLFVVEQAGAIKVLRLGSGTVRRTPFLDIDPLVAGPFVGNDERGLLGLAFHPDYQSNGYFYVNYVNNALTTIISRYTVSADPDVADPRSAVTLLTIDQPFANHNGGWMGFGPLDHYLYISVGDGGGGNDPTGNGQNLDTLLGAMLRIDVSGSDGPGGQYGIPDDNPFVGLPGRDEIWAYGLRNAWRNSFDRATGDFYIVDVGQGAWEEVNFQPFDSTGGENYGWRCMEGSACTGLSGCTCAGSALTPPFQVYGHGCAGGGYSITGGYVYRGCAIPALQGTYFYSDFLCGNTWSLRFDGVSVTDAQSRNAQLSPSIDGFVINQIASFGEDAAGELYLVDRGSGSDGRVFRIVLDPEEFTVLGDLNGDAVVNAADLALLLGQWGTGGCADLNGDGAADAADLALMLGNWS